MTVEGLVECEKCGRYLDDATEAHECLSPEETDAARTQAVELAVDADAKRLSAMEKLRWLHGECVSVHVDINEHRSNYTTVAESIAEGKQFAVRDLRFPSEDVEAKAVELNQLVEVIAYPDTPIGSYSTCHYDIDAAVDAMFRIVRRQREEEKLRET